ncbi:B3 domain-containing protein At2g31420-like [Humulus lupulus]|uniref:B3 domain-containing protein At2g31420-like n=1 Tax=Humulus lupulus TaxID=3486 RepID=UPI002B40EE96|nr:B3 domain-containing protein At2g31420-like [Humulus lupulus]
MELQSKKTTTCKHEEDHSHRRIRALAQVCYEALMKDYGHMVSIVVQDFGERKSNLKLHTRKRGRLRTPIVTTDESKEFQMKRRRSNGGVVGGPYPPPPIPQAMSDVIRSTGHHHHHLPLLVIQKKLFHADIQAQQNRISMPLNQISSDGFLSEAEKKKVDQEGMNVRFIEPSMEENRLILRKWCYKKTKNVSVFSYVFNKNWFGVVEKNGLKVGDIVQVWVFRDKDGNPCFAMVNLGEDATD